HLLIVHGALVLVLLGTDIEIAVGRRVLDHGLGHLGPGLARDARGGGRRRQGPSSARASASAIERRSASSMAIPSRPLPTTRVKRQIFPSAIARLVRPSTFK